MKEILQKHWNGATAGFLPCVRPHAWRVEMEEGDGTKMQQLHGKVRTPLPKSYRNGDAVVGSWHTVAYPGMVALPSSH